MKTIQINFKEEYSFTSETIPRPEAKKYFKALWLRYIISTLSIFLLIGGLTGGIYFGIQCENEGGAASGIGCGIFFAFMIIGVFMRSGDIIDINADETLYPYLLKNENYKNYLINIKEHYNKELYKYKRELTNALEQQIILASRNKVDLDLNKNIEELQNKLSQEETKLTEVQNSLDNLKIYNNSENKRKKRQCLWNIACGYCWTYVTFSIIKKPNRN